MHDSARCSIRPKHQGAPSVRDSVWIGANAILVGDIRIGNNVLIAPGSFANKDVPDNELVIGNPANIFIKTAAIIHGYIVNTVNIYD